MPRFDKLLKTYGASFLDAIAVFAGVVLSRESQNGIVIFYILILGVLYLIAITVFQASRKKSGGNAKPSYPRLVFLQTGRLMAWLYKEGASVAMGAGLALLFAAGVGNSGGWTLFGIFLALGLVMVGGSHLMKGPAPSGPDASP